MNTRHNIPPGETFQRSPVLSGTLAETPVTTKQTQLAPLSPLQIPDTDTKNVSLTKWWLFYATKSWGGL